MRNGISSIIATILMLVITIAMAGTAWMFVSGVFTSTTATAFSIVDSYQDTVTIRNDGTAPITSFSTATVDGQPASIAVVTNVPGLVGYWSFNDGINPTADNSWNGNKGVLGDNIVQNPSFESGGLSWSSGSGVAYDKFSYVYDGVYSMKERYDGAVTDSNIKIDSSSDYTTLLPNTNYTVSVKIDVPQPFKYSLGRDVLLSVGEYDASKNNIRYPYSSGALPGCGASYGGWEVVNLGKTEGWVQLSNTFTTCPNTAYGRVRLAIAANGSDAYFDNVYVSSKAPVFSNDCKFGSCLKFDGANDYVNISDSSGSVFNPKQGSFSISAWIKLNRLPASPNDYVISEKNGDVAAYTFFVSYINSRSGLFLQDSSSIYSEVDGITSLQLGNWYHIVGVRNKATGKTYLYVNGVLDNQANDPTGNIDITLDLFVGGGWGYGYFNGTIDEVKIYNRALTQGEISSLHSSLVPAGQLATIKFLTPLSPGTHAIRICTPGACQTGYLTVV